jgi:hypothetical protein
VAGSGGAAPDGLGVEGGAVGRAAFAGGGGAGQVGYGATSDDAAPDGPGVEEGAVERAAFAGGGGAGQVGYGATSDDAAPDGPGVEEGAVERAAFAGDGGAGQVGLAAGAGRAASDGVVAEDGQIGTGGPLAEPGRAAGGGELDEQHAVGAGAGGAHSPGAEVGDVASSRFGQGSVHVGADDTADDTVDAPVRGELLPVLWSESSRLGLAEVPHWPVAGGRLHLALAVVAVMPRGTVGVFHVSYRQIGEFSFDVLMAEACLNLSAGLRIVGRDTADGQLLSVSGRLVAAAACLPSFYQRVSELAQAERLVVGLPSPDEILVAPDGSGLVAEVHRAVLESEYPAAELVPSVLSVAGDRIEVVAERG